MKWPLPLRHDLGCKVIEIDVQPNHIQVLFGFPPTLTPYKIISRIKGTSSYLLHKEFPELIRQVKNHLWVPSNYHGSVGYGFDVVESYIKTQRDRQNNE